MSDTQTIRHGSRRVVVLDGVGRLALVGPEGSARDEDRGIESRAGADLARWETFTAAVLADPPPDAWRGRGVDFSAAVWSAVPSRSSATPPDVAVLGVRTTADMLEPALDLVRERPADPCTVWPIALAPEGRYAELALVVEVGGWRAVSAGLPTSPDIPCDEVTL